MIFLGLDSRPSIYRLKIFIEQPTIFINDLIPLCLLLVHINLTFLSFCIRVRKKDSKLKALEKANGDYHIQKHLDTVERLPIRSSGEVMVNKDTHEELEEYKANKACDLQIGTSMGSPLVLDLNSKRKRADPDVLQKSEYVSISLFPSSAS